MSVDVIIETPMWDPVDLPRLATRASDAALRHLDLDPEAWEISLLACDDTRIAALNAEFRGKAQPTNVLSWPSAERAAQTPGATPGAPGPNDPELGDIAISYDTCAREARVAGKPVEDHVTHLIVHAILHLLGYDHEDGRDAALMERLEVAILAEIGITDPYAF